MCALLSVPVSTPEQKCIGSPEQKYINDVGKTLWPGASLPAPPRMEAFRQGLRDLGFIDGQNVIIELRYAQGGGATTS